MKTGKEQMYENLKCCGNCIHRHYVSIDTYCDIDGDEIIPNKYCDSWNSDNLQRINRLMKSKIEQCGVMIDNN